MALSLAYLFGKVEEATAARSRGGPKGTPQRYTVKVSMLELYNEQLQVRLLRLFVGIVLPNVYVCSRECIMSVHNPVECASWCVQFGGISLTH